VYRALTHGVSRVSGKHAMQCSKVTTVTHQSTVSWASNVQLRYAAAAHLQQRQRELGANGGPRVVAGGVDQRHLQVLQGSRAVGEPLLHGPALFLDPGEEGAVVLVRVQLLAHVLQSGNRSMTFMHKVHFAGGLAKAEALRQWYPRGGGPPPAE
jgi:hypothetical protein